MLEAERYDVVQAEGIEMARYLPLLQSARRVFSEHNVEYLLQQRAYLVDRAASARWPKAAYSLLQAQQAGSLRGGRLRLADATLAVSEEDAAALRALEPRGRYRVVPNAIDPDGYPRRAGWPARPALLFAGTLDYRPNADAARWLLDAVMPHVWERQPEARVFVVGRGPAPDLVARGQHDPRIAVTGEVESVEPYWTRASVYVLPMRVAVAAPVSRRSRRWQPACRSPRRRWAWKASTPRTARTTWAGPRPVRSPRRWSGCWTTRGCASGSPRRPSGWSASATTGGWWPPACSTSTASWHESARPLAARFAVGRSTAGTHSSAPQGARCKIRRRTVLVAALPGAGVFRQPLWDRLPLETKHRIVAAYSRLTARRGRDRQRRRRSARRVANRIGVNVFLDQEVSTDDRRRSLEMLRAAGVGWVRQQIPWKDIERDAKGDYWDRKWNKDAWANYDSVVDLAHEYGVDIIARVDTSPDWSRPGRRPDDNWHQAPPERFEDYGDFLYTLASRYRGKIKAYQIWNEPNLAIEWGQQAPDPAATPACWRSPTSGSSRPILTPSCSRRRWPRRSRRATAPSTS